MRRDYGREALKRGLLGDASRFLFAGVVNTGLTLLAYQMLLFVMPPPFAYAGSWLAGLCFVALVYPDKVFKQGRHGIGDRALLGTSYCGVFLLGMLLLQLLRAIELAPRLAIFIVLSCTIPLNFALSRGILRR